MLWHHVLAAAVVAVAAGGARALPKSYHIGVFDWDDNLLVMPSVVRFEHRRTVHDAWAPVNLTSAEYADVRLRADYGKLWRPSTTVDAFRDFSDQAGDNTFADQTLRALRGDVPGHEHSGTAGAAMPLLRYHVGNGWPITILTARLHAPQNIASGFALLLRANFTAAERARALANFRTNLASVFDYNMARGYWRAYMADDENVARLFVRASSFYPVSWPVWNKRYRTCASDDCKATAIRQIITERMREVDAAEYPGVPVVSFSDDDEGNRRKVIATLKKDVIPHYASVCFRVYNTTALDAPPVVTQLTAACADVQDDVVPAHVVRTWWHFAAARTVDAMPDDVAAAAAPLA